MSTTPTPAQLPSRGAAHRGRGGRAPGSCPASAGCWPRTWATSTRPTVCLPGPGVRPARLLGRAPDNPRLPRGRGPRRRCRLAGRLAARHRPGRRAAGSDLVLALGVAPPRARRRGHRDRAVPALRPAGRPGGLVDGTLDAVALRDARPGATGRGPGRVRVSEVVAPLTTDVPFTFVGVHVGARAGHRRGRRRPAPLRRERGRFRRAGERRCRRRTSRSAWRRTSRGTTPRLKRMVVGARA